MQSDLNTKIFEDLLTFTSGSHVGFSTESTSGVIQEIPTAALVTGMVNVLKFKSNTFLVLFSNEMLVIREGIPKMLVRTANSVDPDQTASEAV